MVCWSVTTLNTTKMVEPIEMSFGMLSWVGPRSHVLDVGPYLPCKGAIMRGNGAVHCVVVTVCKNG